MLYVQYHSGLQTRKLGQAPIVLFLTLRKVLSSHPHQQMVWLCRLQDRDSIHKQNTINHPTTLHTQWNPVSYFCLPMALCAAVCILQAKFPSLNTLLLASSLQTLGFIEMMYSRPPDLSVILKYVSLPFSWITRHTTHPTLHCLDLYLNDQKKRRYFW